MADHPRSRGVYMQMYEEAANVEGSSPLARGLLLRLRVNSGDRGIIPARAGFTTYEMANYGEVRDHPRSRGVYAPMRVTRWPFSGSSPLARGLRKRRLRILTRLGIIPARAGFTALVAVVALGSGDHPRSRGVYSFNGADLDRTRGSSPLARGLQFVYHQWYEARRIIPARAGFT